MISYDPKPEITVVIGGIDIRITVGHLKREEQLAVLALFAELDRAGQEFLANGTEASAIIKQIGTGAP